MSSVLVAVRTCLRGAQLLQHAKELIKASFDRASQDFQGPLANCLKLAQQAPPAPPGGFCASQWPEDPLLDATSGHLFRTASRHTGFNSRSYQMRKRPRVAEGQSGNASAMGCHAIGTETFPDRVGTLFVCSRSSIKPCLLAWPITPQGELCVSTLQLFLRMYTSSTFTLLSEIAFDTEHDLVDCCAYYKSSCQH